MGRAEPHADHATGTVLDAEDANSMLLASFDARGEAIGTVRVQAFGHLSSGDIDFHGIRAMPETLRGVTSLTAKLITDRAHRRGPLTTRLMLGIFRSAYEHQHRVNLINCNPPLDRFFARFGFVPLGEPRDHPVYGSVRVMMLPMADLPFFEAISSPFAPLLREMAPDLAAAGATRDWCAGLDVRYWESVRAGSDT